MTQACGTDSDEADIGRRFGGIARLYGAAGAQRLQAARIAVVGLGGVGSWTAEALARSAVGGITLIDMDHVSESNTNRQLHALDGAYGMAKVTAMAGRIAAINPRCAVAVVDDFATPANAAALVAGHDVVIDCADDVPAKAALIAAARAAGVMIVTCGAAGGRIDPLRIAQGDLARIAGDPLLARVRHRLRHEHGFPRDNGRAAPKFGVAAVYSDEPVRRPGVLDTGTQRVAVAGDLSCAGFGSAVAVTATMGFVAASIALNRLALPVDSSGEQPARTAARPLRATPSAA